jgi:hypothetical protein
MNCTVPQALIDDALQEDPAAAGAEWLAIFRADLEAYVGREAIEACVDRGVYERSSQPGISYVAFCDPAGGSGQDSMTCAIAHLEGDTVMLDAVRERRPRFSPSDVIDEFCELLKSYRVGTVIGDRFGGEFAREPFRSKQIFYKVSDKAKSDLYRDTLPLLNLCKVRLLDNARLVNQLCSLERRTGTSGRDIIDHPAHGFDDLSNAVAGAVVVCAQKYRRFAQLTMVGLPRVVELDGSGPSGSWVSTAGVGPPAPDRVHHGGRVDHSNVRNADW